MKLSELKSEQYNHYYQTYIDQLPDEELLKILKDSKKEFCGFLKTLTPSGLLKTYAHGKWTVAEVLQHIIDTERIFQYRALCIARRDKTSLPSFDQDAYVQVSLANNRDLSGIIYEFEMLRNAGISLFESFDHHMLQQIGEAGGSPLSPGAAGFIMAGHLKHHLSLFKTNYNL